MEDKYNEDFDDMNYLNLLVRAVPYNYRLRKYYTRKTTHEAITYEVDDSHRFRNSVSVAKIGQSTLESLSGSRSSSMREFIKKMNAEAESEQVYLAGLLGPKDEDIKYPVEIIEWEKDIETWSPNKQFEKESKSLSEETSQSEDSWEKNENDEKKSSVLSSSREDTLKNFKHNCVYVKEYVNSLLEENWEKEVWWRNDEQSADKLGRLRLYVDDPNLIFERNDEKKRGRKKGMLDKTSRSRYNISNDKYYADEGKKASGSLGTFGVQHSPAALRLEDSDYRINLSREELRTLHRRGVDLDKQYVCVCLNQQLNVSLQGDYVNRDILRDAQIYPSQISSQTPLTKNGQATQQLLDNGPLKIFEYAEENPFFIAKRGMVSLLNRYYRPSDSGNDHASGSGCIVLETEEDNPFFGFGEICPGTYVEALANNLFIAPVCGHRVAEYLCVARGDTLVAREIGTIYLVGQEFPKEEVFAPHSRKLNQFCKDRLKVAAHRAFSRGSHLLMSDLDLMFPYFSEGSKRKWLKEYADCVKRGRDNVWVLREVHQLLNEEDIRKLVVPEHICQYESMLVCETKMQMMGIRCSENDEEQEGDRFCPSWTLSRNFINAVNGRGMLELGDNAGDDVFFNFRRVRLKNTGAKYDDTRRLEADNRKLFADLQASYKERINRIWNRQMEFISSDVSRSQSRINCLIREKDNNIIRENGNADKTSISKISTTNGDRKINVTNTTGSTTGNVATSDVLIIRRTYIEDDVSVTRDEKVYDQRVIRAYLRARTKVVVDKKGGLTCSNCGQHGHMKTNKACPNYTVVRTLTKPTKMSKNAKVMKAKPVSDKKRAKLYLQDSMSRLLTKFFNMPFSNAFHRPVSTKKFPNYLFVVKQPIDLSTIRSNVRNSSYKQFQEFIDDFGLMLDNCKLYNGPNHSLTEIAQSIYNQVCGFATENAHYIEECEKLIEELSDNNKDIEDSAI